VIAVISHQASFDVLNQWTDRISNINVIVFRLFGPFPPSCHWSLFVERFFDFCTAHYLDFVEKGLKMSKGFGMLRPNN
jgi:hypothetical protein